MQYKWGHDCFYVYLILFLLFFIFGVFPDWADLVGAGLVVRYVENKLYNMSHVDMTYLASLGLSHISIIVV